MWKVREWNHDCANFVHSLTFLFPAHDNSHCFHPWLDLKKQLSLRRLWHENCGILSRWNVHDMHHFLKCLIVFGSWYVHCKCCTVIWKVLLSHLFLDWNVSLPWFKNFNGTTLIRKRNSLHFQTIRRFFIWTTNAIFCTQNWFSFGIEICTKIEQLHRRPLYRKRLSHNWHRECCYWNYNPFVDSQDRVVYRILGFNHSFYFKSIRFSELFCIRNVGRNQIQAEKSEKFAPAKEIFRWRGQCRPRRRRSFVSWIYSDHISRLKKCQKSFS